MDVKQQQLQLRRQLEAGGIRDLRVLDAIQSTPREKFVAENLQDQAYEDKALPIESQQTISQPFIVALMTQALGLSGHETILEIGTGSGYQAAVLARLCRRVVTIERLPELSHQAEQLLRQLGIDNVVFEIGDGTSGFPALAPYDGIIVTAAAPELPQPLAEQLKIGGKLVIPVGDVESQRLLCIERTAADFVQQDLGGCRFVKLIGSNAWEE